MFNRSRTSKSVRQRVVEWWTGTRRIRVAVMGAKQAGKTVFITALDNYLEYLSIPPLNGRMAKEQLGVLAGWRIQRFTLRKNTSTWRDFDAARHKAELAEVRKWPDVTLEPAVLAYEIDLVKEGEKSRRIFLEVLDIPGERVSDIATMWGHAYAEWSETLFDVHSGTCSRDTLAFRQYVQEVDEALSHGDEQTAKVQICDSYRKFLAHQVWNYSPFLTPSEALLDANGKIVEILPSDDSEEGICSKLHDVTFAPLPTKALKDKRNRRIVRAFERAYKRYMEHAGIAGIVKWMSSVDQLYYLVDVLEILHTGGECWRGVNDQINLALTAGFFRRRGAKMRGFLDLLSRNSMSKICAVATQVDRARLTEDNTKNIERLLKLLFGTAFAGLPRKTDRKFIVCAAVVSTDKAEEGNGDTDVSGTAVIDGEIRHSWPTSLVPDSFDFDKAYFWPRPNPVFSLGRNVKSPEQYRLDEVVREIFGITEEEVFDWREREEASK